MKKFMKKTEGFTLVELIVVIAILGILAGVGTVGYSGYIKKANEAADNQMLSVLNHAYATACIENSVDASTTTAANITIGDDKAIAAADIQVSDPAAKADAIESSFAKYFAGNTGDFKVYTTLTFENGVFVGRAAGDVRSYTYTDSNGVERTVTVNEADVEKLEASAFGNVDVMTMGDLMGEVDALAGVVGSASSVFLNEVFANDPDFTASLYAAMGITATDPDEQAEQLAAKLEEEFGEDWMTDPRAQAINANALVLYTAQASQNMDTSEMLTALGNGATVGSFVDTNDYAGSLTKMAMTYGLCTSYAYATGKVAADATLTYEDIMAFAGTDGFKTYVAENGEADMAGYLSCMNMVNQNLENVDTWDILVNGFSDPDLLGMVNGVLGRNAQ